MRSLFELGQRESQTSGSTAKTEHKRVVLVVGGLLWGLGILLPLIAAAEADNDALAVIALHADRAHDA